MTSVIHVPDYWMPKQIKMKPRVHQFIINNDLNLKIPKLEAQLCLLIF